MRTAKVCVGVAGFQVAGGRLLLVMLSDIKNRFQVTRYRSQGFTRIAFPVTCNL